MKNLQKKSASELQKLLAEKRQDLYDLGLKDAASQLKEVRKIRATRKDIARILTRLSALNDTKQNS